MRVLVAHVIAILDDLENTAAVMDEKAVEPSHYATHVNGVIEMLKDQKVFDPNDCLMAFE